MPVTLLHRPIYKGLMHSCQMPLHLTAMVRTIISASYRPMYSPAVSTLRYTMKSKKCWQRAAYPDGKDMGGRQMPPGNYPVLIRYKTRDGREVNTCACIKLLEYNKDGCIETSGQQLYFEDQLDTQTGFTYNTGETLCK